MSVISPHWSEWRNRGSTASRTLMQTVNLRSERTSRGERTRYYTEIKFPVQEIGSQLSRRLRPSGLASPIYSLNLFEVRHSWALDRKVSSSTVARCRPWGMLTYCGLLFFHRCHEQNKPDRRSIQLSPGFEENGEIVQNWRL